MTLRYVLLNCDLLDGQGSFPAAGQAQFIPSSVLTSAADHQIITRNPVTAAFRRTGQPSVRLLATDSSGPSPAGWTWRVTFTGVPGNPDGFSFFLPYSAGASQRLSDQVPV